MQGNLVLRYHCKFVSNAFQYIQFDVLKVYEHIICFWVAVGHVGSLIPYHNLNVSQKTFIQNICLEFLPPVSAFVFILSLRVGVWIIDRLLMWWCHFAGCLYSLLHTCHIYSYFLFTSVFISSVIS